jgi:hypothetical protein
MFFLIFLTPRPERIIIPLDRGGGVSCRPHRR